MTTAMTTAVVEDSYRTCRELHRRHGTTYYWATALLPAESRRHVHALYGFCRYADEIVDDLGPADADARARALLALQEQTTEDLIRGRSDHPVLAALVDTVVTLGIAPGAIGRFIRSMAMDLTVSSYASFADLEVYMDGSAAVIGEMMLPVLDPHHGPEAVEPARALGVAFQLTNFLRDVDEDLRRGRVYIPEEDLHRFGADPRLRQVTPEWAELMRFEIGRIRDLYEVADTGIAMLPPRSAACVRAARILYSEILDRIEARGYDVFSSRARVGTGRKLVTAGRCLAGTIGTRNP